MAKIIKPKRKKIPREAVRATAVVIKTLSFRSSLQLKPFQHVHIEATADVPAGATPGVVMEVLKAYVAAELRIAKEGFPTPQPHVDGRFRDLLEEANPGVTHLERPRG